MKKQNDITFLCELPPPYGGVTVKNYLLLQHVFSDMSVDVVDFFDCKRCIWNIPVVFFKMIRSFLKKQVIVYGFGGRYHRLDIAVKLQALFGGRKSLANTVNIVMGGTFPEHMDSNPNMKARYAMMRANFVESQMMMTAMEKLGMDNARFFPNPKSAEGACQPRKVDGAYVRFVYFSQISTPKGVRLIMEMVASMTKEERERTPIDFYGHVTKELQADFQKFIHEHRNVRYCGVFDTAKENVYAKLNEYDVLLFPTMWKTEGVPGILIEAKMAGICPVVSDVCYNGEIVTNGVEGIVLRNNTSQELKYAVQKLLEDITLLSQLKLGSYISRERYVIDNYTDSIRTLLLK